MRPMLTCRLEFSDYRLNFVLTRAGWRHRCVLFCKDKAIERIRNEIAEADYNGFDDACDVWLPRDDSASCRY